MKNGTFFTCLATLFAFCAVISLPVQSGFYAGGELGVNFGSSLDTTGSSNDRASVCDEYINPRYAEVENTAGYEDYNCTGPNRGVGDDWRNDFKSGDGILLGTALGYRAGDSKLRVELEYLYRDTGYDRTSSVPGATGVSGDKLAQEIVTANERIGSVTSHSLFVNMYVDFVNNSRLTPYIGFGAGFGFTDVDYGAVFQRNLDKGAIQTGEGLPNFDEIRENLAGSTTTAQERLSDTLFGYQVLCGVDYGLTESVSLGIKGRWISYDSFKDGEPRDTLRSHPSNLRLDGSEPVVGYLKIDDIDMFAVSMSLKYKF